MAYVSGKDGAHTQDLGAINRASERMPNLKLSFLLGCTIDLHQSASRNGFSFVDFCGAATTMLQLNIASSRSCAEVPPMQRSIDVAGLASTPNGGVMRPEPKTARAVLDSKRIY